MLESMSNSTLNTQKVEDNPIIYFKLFLAVSATITLFLVYVNLNNINLNNINLSNIKSLFQKTKEKITRKLNDIAIVTTLIVLLLALTMIPSNSSKRAPGGDTPANGRPGTAEDLSTTATTATTAAEDLLTATTATTTATTAAEDLLTATTEAKISEADIKALPVDAFYAPLLIIKEVIKAFFVILMIAFVVCGLYRAITYWTKGHLAKEDKLVDESENNGAKMEKILEKVREVAKKEREADKAAADAKEKAKAAAKAAKAAKEAAEKAEYGKGIQKAFSKAFLFYDAADKMRRAEAAANASIAAEKAAAAAIRDKIKVDKDCSTELWKIISKAQ